MQFYGIDWLVLVLVLLNVWLVGERKRIGFLVGVAACMAGIVFSLLISSVANGICSSLLLILNIRAWWLWGAAEK